MPICANARYNRCQVGPGNQKPDLFKSLKTGYLTTTCLACREYMAAKKRENPKMKSVAFPKWTVDDFDTEREFRQFREWLISLRIRE